jgi:hypothetical protein
MRTPLDGDRDGADSDERGEEHRQQDGERPGGAVERRECARDRA